MLKRTLFLALIAVSVSIGVALSAVKGQAQAAPAVVGGHSPEVEVGGTLSDFSPDFTLDRLYGFGAYVDVIPLRTRHWDLGFEGELQVLNLHQVVHVHETTKSFGVEGIYHDIKGLRPFGKVMYGLGTFYNPYFTPVRPSFYKDTYGIWVTGGGADYRLSHRLGVRVEYEYQDWTHFRTAKTLNPQGIMFGVSYRIH